MSKIQEENKEYLSDEDILKRSIPDLEEADDDDSENQNGNAVPAPKKGSKRDFAVFGFNPTSTEIRLPLLTGQRTIEYVKWSKEANSKLKALGINQFIKINEVKCLTLAYDDDDGYHSKESVKRMYLMIHSRIAAALRVATSAVLGTTLFEEMEDMHAKEEEKYEAGDREKAPFIDKNAYVLWNLIGRKLNRRTDADTQFLYNKIQNLKYQYGKDPIDLKRRFDELKRELLTLGFDGITEKMSKMLWLNYIPKELEAIKQSMECRSSYDTDDIYNALYANYVRSFAENRGKFAKSNPREQQANAVDEEEAETQEFKSQSGLKDLYCTHCKRNGHKDDTCWKLELISLRKQVAQLKISEPEELSSIQNDSDSNEEEEGLFTLTEAARSKAHSPTSMQCNPIYNDGKFCYILKQPIRFKHDDYLVKIHLNQPNYAEKKVTLPPKESWREVEDLELTNLIKVEANPATNDILASPLAEQFYLTPSQSCQADHSWERPKKLPMKQAKVNLAAGGQRHILGSDIGKAPLTVREFYSKAPDDHQHPQAWERVKQTTPLKKIKARFKVRRQQQTASGYNNKDFSSLREQNYLKLPQHRKVGSSKIKWKLNNSFKSKLNSQSEVENKFSRINPLRDKSGFGTHHNLWKNISTID